MFEYAQSLISVIEEMGLKQSNPVLELLGKNTSVTLEKKYPEVKGYLGNNEWRAFYHCHDSQQKPKEEHGHFHVFINVDNVEDTSVWPHLACLSIDCYGQPLQWFTVNQWVTNGSWLTSDQLMESLSQCEINESMSLVEKWLLCMVRCYQNDINQLLQDRDTHLLDLGWDQKSEELMKDRGLYVLSEQVVNLGAKLENIFSEEQQREQAEVI